MKLRRGATIEKLTNERTRRSAVIRLDKSDMTFFCELDGTLFEDKDGRALHFEIEKQLKRRAQVEATWLPVLRVQFSDGNRYGLGGHHNDEQHGGVSLEVERFFYAAVNPLVKQSKVESVELLRLPWEDVEGPHAVSNDQKIERAGRWDIARSGYGNEVRSAHFKLPYRNHRDEYYLAYTDVMWQNLTDIIAAIDNAHSAVRSLLTTDKGIKRLSQKADAVLLLGSGS